jgi:alanine-glyoxylate transaminase/(R)-3-amino-2-methylpropionate-pyruvate transaminase
VSVGHCHPEVVKAVDAQNHLLQHTTTIYLNNQIAEYAKELADKMPGNLKVSQGVDTRAYGSCAPLLLSAKPWQCHFW